jgi:hypothetical protein
MTKKNIREEIKKPDLVQTAFNNSIMWIKANGRLCIIAAAVVVLAGLSGWAYAAHRASVEDRAQYALSEGIKNFQEYAMANKQDALSKAEAGFRDVVKGASGRTKAVARLYLAKIALVKGKNEEAKTLYTDIAGKSSSDVAKKLSEEALKNLEKK